MNNYGQGQYKRTQVTTVDKGRLIVLLYEGAIKFLHQARDCAVAKDVEGKSNNINKALDIIHELNQSLNMADGGDVAQNLRRLYIFMSDHLIQGKIKKETKHLDQVIDMLSNLNEAWNQVASMPEAQNAVPKEERKSLKTQITV